MDLQIDNPPEAQLSIRKAAETDLIHLEWDGEYRHFRKLYQEIYQSSQKGDAILWVVDFNETGIIGQVFIQLNSARKELADGFNRAYLYGFRIHPKYRNLGIGSFVLQFVEKEHPDILSDIKQKQQIDSSIEEKLTKALNEFKDKFTY